jgi:hypothetical protein
VWISTFKGNYLQSKRPKVTTWDKTHGKFVTEENKYLNFQVCEKRRARSKISEQQGTLTATSLTPTLTLPWKCPLRASDSYWSRQEVKILARTSALPLWTTYSWPTPQDYGKRGLPALLAYKGLWFETGLINNRSLKVIPVKNVTWWRKGMWVWMLKHRYAGEVWTGLWNKLMFCQYIGVWGSVVVKALRY